MKLIRLKNLKNNTSMKKTNNNLTSFESHIDDQYGIDVDDLYRIEEVLSPSTLSQYQIVLADAIVEKHDELHLGYFKLSSL